MAKGLEDAIEHAVDIQEKVCRAEVLERLSDTVDMLAQSVCPRCGRTGRLEPGIESGCLICGKCGFIVPVARDFSLEYSEFIERFFRGTIVSGMFPGVGYVFVKKYRLGNNVHETMALEVLCIEVGEETREIAIRFVPPGGCRCVGDTVYSGFVCGSGLREINLEKQV